MKLFPSIIFGVITLLASGHAAPDFRDLLDSKKLSEVLDKLDANASSWPVIESDLNCRKREGKALRAGLKNLALAKDLLALAMTEIETNPESFGVDKIRQCLNIDVSLRKIGGDGNYVLAHMFSFLAGERILEMIMRGREHDAELRIIIAQRKRLDEEAPVQKLFLEIVPDSTEWIPARKAAQTTKYPDNFLRFCNDLTEQNVLPPPFKLEPTCDEMLLTPSYTGLFQGTLTNEATICFIAPGAMEYFSKGGTWEMLYAPNGNPVRAILGKGVSQFKFLPFQRKEITGADLTLRDRCLDKLNLLNQSKIVIKR